ncbi:EscF/YscF/HrpA family type III secretion system needle major subunit [Desulfospira joergensenii]|uniref:EscF/YscF/HrpA family type III secretion system needle major subunit n=1 Tax=Desulfospira joergensenii TaxID=53329 RepID=UPI0003B44E50|nr:EscF/YscF/HrpA family type III secretion system needle major subunit [Desulfospira joergensenii]
MSTSTTGVSTPTIKTAFEELQGKVSSAGEDLQGDITKALEGEDLDPMQMLDLQFKMGRFNAMVEAASSVTKGLTDTAKTLAQRAGG